MTMTRKMGIDYGSVRIGVAISDPLGITARGIETIRWNGRDMEWAIDRIAALCSENQVDTIIVGLPRRTDGKESPSEQNANAAGKTGGGKILCTGDIEGREIYHRSGEPDHDRDRNETIQETVGCRPDCRRNNFTRFSGSLPRPLK